MFNHESVKPETRTGEGLIPPADQPETDVVSQAVVRQEIVSATGWIDGKPILVRLIPGGANPFDF